MPFYSFCLTWLVGSVPLNKVSGQTLALDDSCNDGLLPAQVVTTLDNVTINIPSQDYTHHLI